MPTENSITFAWTPIDGAQGYTINTSINGIAQPPTTSTSSEYTLSGLLPETLVEFSVTAFSSPNCPTSATVAQSCNTTAVPCALNPLQIGSLMTAFCLDDEPTDLDIQPIGGTWIGNGINGNAFDPMLAGAGLHEVTYSLMQIDGTTECVFDTTLTFSVSQVTINNTISDTTKLPPNINELTVTIDASSALGDMLVYTWLENGTTVLCSGLDCETFTLNPSETTTYSVIVTDEYGCEASITTVVELRQADMLLMPNAFSPNGDGINDLFKVSGLHIAEYQLRIYDRLSTMVYDSQLTQDLDTGWDGIYDGRPARLGVYVYHVLATFEDGSQCTIRGNVTLVR
ncbi:MAG: gliding motility-associated C-terminal domain-containing protein [Sphingobacteriales bacterium]|nr:gliding motility-associated C-terminal domain-containing protein [Sphingobacteriales bacterium]